MIAPTPEIAGPACLECGSARVERRSYSWARCGGCGAEWRAKPDQITDLDAAQRRRRRRSARPMAHEIDSDQLHAAR